MEYEEEEKKKKRRRRRRKRTRGSGNVMKGRLRGFKKEGRRTYSKQGMREKERTQ